MHAAGPGLGNQPEAVAAQSGHVWVGHAQHRVGGYRSIDSAAPILQRVQPGRTGEVVWSRYHSVRRVGRWSAGTRTVWMTHPVLCVDAVIRAETTPSIQSEVRRTTSTGQAAVRT